MKKLQQQQEKRAYFPSFTLFRCGLIAFIVAIVIVYIYFRSLDETLDPKELHRQHCSNFESTQRDLSPFLPTCIVEWRKRITKSIVAKNISRIEVGNSLCEEAMLIGQPLRTLFHQPHFAYRFFPFLSYVLWQNDLHGVDRCLKYFVVPNEAIDFWRGQSKTEGKLSWPKKVSNKLARYLGPFVIPESCAIEKKMKYVTKSNVFEWFLHESDASLFSHLLSKEEEDPCQYFGGGNKLLSAATVNVSVIQREKARRILNIEEVLSMITTSLLLLKKIFRKFYNQLGVQ